MQKKIRELKSKFEKIQNLLRNQLSNIQERITVDELDERYRREETYWREKAKARWREEGDANKHYFHVTTIVRRRFNTINCIRDSHNNWIVKRGLIGKEFEKYFVNLFTSDNPIMPQDLRIYIQPTITEIQNVMLAAIPMPEEIRKVVFTMGNYKSPGPNGMTVVFYKKHWGTIGAAMGEEV